MLWDHVLPTKSSVQSEGKKKGGRTPQKKQQKEAKGHSSRSEASLMVPRGTSLLVSISLKRIHGLHAQSYKEKKSATLL